MLDPDEGDDEIAPSSSTGGPDRHEHQATASDRTDAAAIDEGGPVRHEHQAWADNTRDVFVWLPLASCTAVVAVEVAASPDRA